MSAAGSAGLCGDGRKLDLVAQPDDDGDSIVVRQRVDDVPLDTRGRRGAGESGAVAPSTSRHSRPGVTRGQGLRPACCGRRGDQQHDRQYERAGARATDQFPRPPMGAATLARLLPELQTTIADLV